MRSQMNFTYEPGKSSPWISKHGNSGNIQNWELQAYSVTTYVGYKNTATQPIVAELDNTMAATVTKKRGAEFAELSTPWFYR